MEILRLKRLARLNGAERTGGARATRFRSSGGNERERGRLDGDRMAHDKRALERAGPSRDGVGSNQNGVWARVRLESEPDGLGFEFQAEIWRNY